MIDHITLALILVAAAILLVGLGLYLKKHPLDLSALHTKLDNILARVEATHAVAQAAHNAALAPVSVAIVPASPLAPPAAAPAPSPAPVPVPLPPGGNTTDPTAPGFIMPAQPAPPPAPVEDNPFVPQPTMTYAYCTGQNIPLNPGTSYTITECPARTNVETNITTLPCDPYVLTVNGVGTKKEVQTGQCTVYAAGPTITVSVAPITSPGVVNLILQIQPGE